MKIILAVLVVVLAAVALGAYLLPNNTDNINLVVPDPVASVPNTLSTTTPAATTSTSTPSKPVSTYVEVVATGLNIPWDIAFLPTGELLVTERTGKLVRISTTGEKKSLVVTGVRTTGESGLLGVTLHPQFATNHWLYLYITETAGQGLINKVVRYKYIADELIEPKIIISGIPGAIYHDGGRMEFGPDGLLYITTGDATQEALAQNRSSLAGKLLRLKDDGSIPADNPWGTAVYTYGHRNSQGLAWDTAGRLWSTEHGRSGATSGYDEINLIVRGGNYGWPTIEGPATKDGLISPAWQSGASDTWAPASALYLNGSLFFGGLRGEALLEAKLDGAKVTAVKKHFLKQYGRIRTVRLGPDGMIYFTTSNRDGRGTVRTGDDKIFRINPARFK
jgi:glucose/arabinose dehydrogenase